MSPDDLRAKSLVLGAESLDGADEIADDDAPARQKIKKRPYIARREAQDLVEFLVGELEEATAMDITVQLFRPQ